MSVIAPISTEPVVLECRQVLVCNVCLQIVNYSWQNGALQSRLLFKCTGLGQYGLGWMVLRCRCPGPDTGDKFTRAYSEVVHGMCGITSEEVVHIPDSGLVITPQRGILSWHTHPTLRPWLAHSTFLFSWGLKPEKRLTVAPKGFQKAFKPW